MRSAHDPRRTRAARLAVCALLAATACAPTPEAPVRAVWLAAAPMPAFDPHGPPDPLREALERALSRGLTELDSSGAVHGALAERWAWSADRCTLTFTLREGLRFADGSPVEAEHVRASLLAALARTDHRRAAHLLSAVVGAEPDRRRPVPPGVRAPDPRTLVLALTRPDPRLPAALALPGLSAPWRGGAAEWPEADGCGPYRVVRDQPGRALVLARRESGLPVEATVDTLEVGFVLGASRARDALRRGEPDALWPLPPELLGGDAPAGYRTRQAAANPPRRLMLVLRADRPPLSRIGHRQRLSRAVEPRLLAARLGHGAHPAPGWVPGLPAAPGVGPGAGRVGLRRAPVAERPGAPRGPEGPGSFHIRMGFDADGPAARIAGVLEDRWAEDGLYVEREPLRGGRWAQRSGSREGPHALLVVAQPLFDGAAEALAPFAESPAGVPMAGFRTGWRPRDLAAALSGGRPLDSLAVAERLRAEQVALPIAGLDWVWFERETGSHARVHPRFGLEYTELRPFGDSRTGH